MNKLIVILSFISYISCANICKENGLFPNNGDNTAYYQCNEGKATFIRCPRSEDNLVYLVFDGRECVDGRKAVPLTSVDNIEPVNVEVQPQEQNTICPTGTTYDSQRGQCRREELAEPVIENEPVPSQSYSCPDGFTYDPSLNKCQGVEYADPILIVTPDCPSPDKKFADPRDAHFYYICENNVGRREVCPEDTVFSESADRCINPSDVMVNDTPQSSRLQPRQAYQERTESCLAGYSYDPATGRCKRIERTEVETVISNVPGREIVECPPDTVYDSSTGQCRKEILVPPIRSTESETSSRLSCQTGFTYNPSTGNCEKIDYTCPIGQTYDYVTQRCTASSICPFGQTYDYTLRRCVGTTNPTRPNCRTGSYCPANYTLDTISRNCCSQLVVPAVLRPGNKTYECQSGFEYDWVLHKCLLCEETPPNKDVTPPEYVCPDHFVYILSRHRCVRTIWMPAIRVSVPGICRCPPGYEWRPHMFQCVKIHTANCIVGPCPPVSTYQPFRPNPKNMICPSGSTYDISTGECRSEIDNSGRGRSLCPQDVYCPTGFKLEGINCSSEIDIPPVRIEGKETFSCRPGFHYDPVFHKCRRCSENPVKEVTTPPSYICPSNGAGHFTYDEYTRECRKQICVPPSYDYTTPPCDCPDGYYWSHHLKQCVRIEVAPCVDEPCPPSPTFRPPCPIGRYWNEQSFTCATPGGTCPAGQYWSDQRMECLISRPFR